MSDHFDELLALLKDCGARPTLDFARNNTHPCFMCGESAKKYRDLRHVGSFIGPAPGGFLRGDAMDRPICERCLTVEPVPAPVSYRAQPRAEDDDAPDGAA